MLDTWGNSDACKRGLLDDFHLYDMDKLDRQIELFPHLRLIHVLRVYIDQGQCHTFYDYFSSHIFYKHGNHDHYNSDQLNIYFFCYDTDKYGS